MRAKVRVSPSGMSESSGLYGSGARSDLTLWVAAAGPVLVDSEFVCLVLLDINFYFRLFLVRLMHSSQCAPT